VELLKGDYALAIMMPTKMIFLAIGRSGAYVEIIAQSTNGCI
jgi:hypothetical protein